MLPLTDDSWAVDRQLATILDPREERVGSRPDRERARVTREARPRRRVDARTRRHRRQLGVGAERSDRRVVVHARDDLGDRLELRHAGAGREEVTQEEFRMVVDAYPDIVRGTREVG